jgi:hypothetical protein
MDQRMADAYGHWIVLLIIHALMRRPPGQEIRELSNERFRSLFRFIALGLEAGSNASRLS